MIALLLSLFLFVDPFWVNKPATEWSEPELLALLTNSPWAQPVDGPGPNAPAVEVYLATAGPMQLAETERDHILGVLEQTHGVVSGPNGAASRLGLPRTTLTYRMQRLGIVQRRTVLRDRGAERRDRNAFAIRASPC